MKSGQDFEMKKTSFPQINLLINNPLKKGFRYYEENNEKTSQLFGYPMSLAYYLFYFIFIKNLIFSPIRKHCNI